MAHNAGSDGFGYGVTAPSQAAPSGAALSPVPTPVPALPVREGEISARVSEGELSASLFEGMPGLDQSAPPPQLQQPQQPGGVQQPAEYVPAPVPGTPNQLVQEPYQQPYQQQPVAGQPQPGFQQPTSQIPPAQAPVQAPVQQQYGQAPQPPAPQPPAQQQPVPQSQAPVQSPVPASPAPHPDSPPPQNFIGAMQELGFADLDPNNVELAQARALQAYRREQQQRQQYEAMVRQLQSQLQSQQPVVAPAPTSATGPAVHDAAAQAQRWAWNPPEINQTEINKWRIRDAETGETGWKQNTPQQVIDQATSYEQHFENWQQTLLLNPDKVFGKGGIVDQAVDDRARELITAEFDRRERERVAAEFSHRVESDYGFLFEQDPVTGKPARGIDGGYLLTQAGQAINELTGQFPEGTNQQFALDAAIAMYERQHGTLRPVSPSAAAQPPVLTQPAAPTATQATQITPQQAAANAQALAAQQRAAHLAKHAPAGALPGSPQIIPFPQQAQAGYLPNMGGTIPQQVPGGVPAQLQNPAQDLGSFLLGELQKDGIAV